MKAHSIIFGSKNTKKKGVLTTKKEAISKIPDEGL
jgi:hypothetical protein